MEESVVGEIRRIGVRHDCMGAELTYSESARLGRGLWKRRWAKCGPAGTRTGSPSSKGRVQGASESGLDRSRGVQILAIYGAIGNSKSRDLFGDQKGSESFVETYSPVVLEAET